MPKQRKMSSYNMEMNKILKDSIQEAMCLLMKEKKFEDISVSEICLKAGVSRTGFYRNYKEKKDIIDELSLQVFNEVHKKVSLIIGNKVVNRLNWFIDYFTCLLENEWIIKLLKEAGFQGPNLDKTTSLLLENENINSEEDKLKVIIFNGALHNVALYWLYQEEKMSVQEIAEYSMKFLLY